MFCSNLGYYHRETQTIRYLIYNNSSVISNDNHVLIQIDNNLAYKNMNTYLYCSITIIQVFFIAFCSCVVPNLEIVILISSAVSSTCLSFFFPAVLYLLAEKQSRHRLIDKHNQKIQYREELNYQAYFLLLVGVFLLVFGLIDGI